MLEALFHNLGYFEEKLFSFSDIISVTYNIADNSTV